MEGFTYVDIFATKGIEYIVAIAFLIMLIWFWKWLNYPAASSVPINQSKSNRITQVDWFRLASNFYYHQGHSWVNPEKNDIVNIGIDDFAQKLIGKPDKLNLPQIGTELKQGEKSLQFEIDGKIIDFLSPVDGHVIAINEKVINSPEIINQDPYEEGWLIKVKSKRLRSNLKNLLSGHIARAWIEDTVNKLSKSITGGHGVVLQDGGTIRNGFVKELAPDHWEQVAAEYFLTKDLL
jgi:glycine cleavage system H protein